MKDRPELTKLIAESVASFNALTPAQQRQHREEQRRSWTIGEMMLANPDMTREQAIKLYEDLA